MTDPQSPDFTPQPSPPEEPERYPFWTWQDVVLLAALTLPSLIAALLLVTGIFRAISFVPRARAVVPIAAQFLFYALWFLIVYLVIRLRYSRPFWRSLGFVQIREWMGKAAWWGLATAGAAILLAQVLRPPEIKSPLEELLRDPASVVLMVTFGVTLGPLCEELAFRGLLLPLVMRSIGAVAGIVLTAVPFALLHGPEYAWSWKHLSLILMAGCAFGWVRWRTGSTAAAAITHSVYNLTFFIGYFAAQKAAH